MCWQKKKHAAEEDAASAKNVCIQRCSQLYGLCWQTKKHAAEEDAASAKNVCIQRCSQLYGMCWQTKKHAAEEDAASAKNVIVARATRGSAPSPQRSSLDPASRNRALEFAQTLPLSFSLGWRACSFSFGRDHRQNSLIERRGARQITGVVDCLGNR
jgi:hypothetical protein